MRPRVRRVLVLKLTDGDAPPYVPGAPCNRCNRTVPVGQQDHEPVQLLTATGWQTQQRTVCRGGCPSAEAEQEGTR